MYKEHEIKKKYFKIEEVYKITGIPKSKLRFWTDEIMDVKRNGHKDRMYTQSQIEVLKRFKMLQKYLTIQEIGIYIQPQCL